MAKELVKLLSPLVKTQQIMLLLADQYTAFDSEEFKEYLEKHGTQIVVPSINCAISNGLNERVSQTLVNRIRCQINDNNNQWKSWTTIANKCVAQYNKTIHSSTRFTPEYLLYGKTQFLSPLYKNTNSLEEDCKQAFLNSTKSFKANKKQIDKK